MHLCQSWDELLTTAPCDSDPSLFEDPQHPVPMTRIRMNRWVQTGTDPENDCSNEILLVLLPRQALTALPAPRNSW